MFSLVARPDFQKAVRLMRDVDIARGLEDDDRAGQLERAAQEAALEALKAAHSPEPADPDDLEACLQTQIDQLGRVAGPPLMPLLRILEARRSELAANKEMHRSIFGPTPACPHDN